MRATEVAVVGFVVLIAAGSQWVSAARSSGDVVGPVLVLGGVLVAIVAALVLLRRRYHSWGYLERDEDLLVRRGVMVRRLSVVPYGRMQFVEVTAGLIERSFGLATVKLHTAAARSDARIPGLEPQEAARLRDQLASLGEAKAAGL